MIEDIRPQGVPAAPSAATPPTRPAARAPEAAPRRRGDSVEISPEARARLAQAPAGGLAPERVAELRQRILRRAYDDTAVIRTVAERILGSGDLGQGPESMEKST